MKIYLDDIRTPIDDYNWTIVRSYDEFVDLIHSIDDFSDIELISLDHDLGESAMNEFFISQQTYKINYDRIKEKTGLDCAKFLVDYYLDMTDPKGLGVESSIPFPVVKVHSANPIGSANIMGYINNFLMTLRKPQTCVRWRPSIKPIG